MFVRIKNAWLKKSKTHPIIFNSVNGALLYGIGDFAQQKLDVNKILVTHPKQNYFIEEKNLKKTQPKEPFNPHQFLKMVSWAVISAPMFHFWYTKFLPFFIPVIKSPSNKQAMSKVFIDYTLASTT